jgi:hypothetical protein
METRRFDELTVALARGGSRRGVLRGVAGGLLGALALNRSGALAKKDKDESEKAEAKPEQGGGTEHGGGRPIISPAKPVCPSKTDYRNCPLCSEARFGDPAMGETDRAPGCCDPMKREENCKNCHDENATYCGVLNEGQGSCVQNVQCVQREDGKLRCDYKVKPEFCPQGTHCCPVFTSPNFGHCYSLEAGETCEQVPWS